MATTTNNSGIGGDDPNDFGPDEKWDDESVEEYNVRMQKKREAAERKKIEDARRMPPCIG